MEYIAIVCHSWLIVMVHLTCVKLNCLIWMYVGTIYTVFFSFSSFSNGIGKLNFCIFLNWSLLSFLNTFVSEVRTLCFVNFFTARCSSASAVLGFRNSVSLSVTRVLCDKKKEHTADILITYYRAITLVFWYQHRLVGDVPFHLTLALKVLHPLRKTPTSILLQLYCHNHRHSSVITNIFPMC